MLDSRLNDLAQITKSILRAKLRLESALLDDMAHASHDLVVQAIADLESTRKCLDVLFYAISTEKAAKQ